MIAALTRFAAEWQRFWFAPQSTASLALFRIAFGLVATAWTLTLAPNLLTFYTPSGIRPLHIATTPGDWSLLTLSNGPVVPLVVFVVTAFAAIAVTVGLFTRIAAVLLWAGVQSLIVGNVLVTNSGDGLVRNLALLCALSPAGTALSLDRLRRMPGHFWEFPPRPVWSLRLVQIQLSVVYLTSVWDKAHSPLWTDGTAVSYPLRMDDVQRLIVPDFVTHSVLLVNILTYGTLVAELSLGVLVWNRAARPWVLLVGISLHLGIDATIIVGFFSWAILSAYLSFVPPETAARVVLGTRDGVQRAIAAWHAAVNRPGIAGEADSPDLLNGGSTAEVAGGVAGASDAVRARGQA